MNDNIKGIADLLPEGLSESAVNEICELVNGVIVEQVQDQVEELETKVYGFLRLKIDDLKDQALQELNENNEIYRNANLFEQIKSLMSIELTEEDDETALANMMKEAHEANAERDIVITEFNKSLEENEDLQNAVKVLSDRLISLEEENESLEESVSVLKENKDKPFKSSEQAQVISNDVDSPTKGTTYNNEFLTEEVMKFMPFNS